MTRVAGTSCERRHSVGIFDGSFRHLEARERSDKSYDFAEKKWLGEKVNYPIGSVLKTNRVVFFLSFYVLSSGVKILMFEK